MSKLQRILNKEFLLIACFLIGTVPINAGVKIGGFYEAKYNYEYDSRDKEWHISNFPSLLKVEFYDQSNQNISKKSDIFPLSASEPYHRIGLEFNIQDAANVTGLISINAQSNNDLDKRNRQLPVYLGRTDLDYKSQISPGMLDINLYVKKNPGSFDDPLLLFNPGHIDNFIFEEYPREASGLGWFGDDSQGIKVSLDNRERGLSFTSIFFDSYSKYYYDWQGNKFYNDTWGLALRAKKTWQEGLALGATYVKKGWFSASSPTREESNGTVAVDLGFAPFYAEFANSMTNYYAKDNNIFSDGAGMKIGVKREFSGGSYVDASVRSLQPKFVSEFRQTFYSNDGRLYNNEKGVNLNLLLQSAPEKRKLYFSYDSKTNYGGGRPVADYRLYYEKAYEKISANIKLQRINFYAYNDDRTSYGIRPYLEIKTGAVSPYFEFTSTALDKPNLRGLTRSNEYLGGLKGNITKKLSFNVNAKLVDNLITQNVDEYLYFLGEFEKLKLKRPLDTAPFYRISAEDDWIFEGDGLTHYYYWLEAEYKLAQGYSLKYFVKLGDPYISVGSGEISSVTKWMAVNFRMSF